MTLGGKFGGQNLNMFRRTILNVFAHNLNALAPPSLMLSAQILNVFGAQPLIVNATSLMFLVHILNAKVPPTLMLTPNP
jgi:hypothetical protein